jgi:hypothetical protein
MNQKLINEKIYNEMIKPIDLLVESCEKTAKDHKSEFISIILLKQYAKILKESYKKGLNA